MRKKWIIIAQIAATYIGTVVGAGFATGQEILQFFTAFGFWGLLGIILSTALFIWIGTKMMILAKRIKAYSYQQFNEYLFGKVIGTAVNLFVFVTLFGVTCVMLSGTGAIFEEQLHWPYQAGIIVTLVLCYFVMLKGMQGIFWVNSLVVPLMIFFSVIVALKVGFVDHELLRTKMTQAWEGWEGWKWLTSAFTYVAFNLAMAQAVLIPLGREIDDESMLGWGGLWGGVGLGLMLTASHFALQTIMPEALHFDIPIAVVIQNIGWFILFMFLLVVYGEIFTTLIANVFGMARQIRTMFALPQKWTVAAILLASFLISQIGFSPLVSSLYPLFGYLGLGVLVYLVVMRLPEEKSDH